MLRLILCTALLSAATAYIAPYNARSEALIKDATTVPEVSPLHQAELSPTKSEDVAISSTSSTYSPTASTAPSASSSSVSSQNDDMEDPIEGQEIISELPVTSPSLLENVDTPIRRVITYDQRQEGQYNIRADLDNFMIVLIPPSSADGLSLLDLFTKSTLRKTSHSSSKNKKKQYSSSLALQPESGSKFKHLLKNPEYFPRHHAALELASSSGGGEFIEGRTPYHVDISSLHGDGEGVQARLNPDRQVDVLPPPYPLAYQHLIKPYLEAESSVMQTLPPADLTSHQNSEMAHNTGFYRFARYSRDNNFLDTNRRITQIPTYRSDLSMGASKLYPPLDIPHFSLPSSARNLDNSKSSTSGEDEDPEGKQTLEAGDIGDISYDDYKWEMRSRNLINGKIWALASDSIARCDPGQRRNSYGECGEIEGY